MYCFNCHKFFPDDDVVREADGETAAFIYCCPWCGVDDIGESAECAICGEEFPADELCCGVCDDCFVYYDPPQ